MLTIMKNNTAIATLCIN